LGPVKIVDRRHVPPLPN